jgi:thiol-disulfide isomerase/thioredoxin
MLDDSPAEGPDTPAERASPPAPAPGAALVDRRTVRAPEFAPGLEWVYPGRRQADASDPTLAALRGRVVLVDLWTYGCINCQHVAPELRALERQFGDRIAIVSVHSGKFIAERASARIEHAAERLGVEHPVVNDRQFRLWRAWAARGWPTLALVDAAGYVAFQQAGERRATELAGMVTALLGRAEAAGELASGPLPWRRGHALAAAELPTLRYPSAVAVGAADASGGRPFAVADAGHHRVLVGRLAADGRSFGVTRVVGRGMRTRDVHPAHWDGTNAPLTRETFALVADGAADVASFDRPQGVAFAADGVTLYVADTGNHALRTVDVATGRVRTVAGTGARLRTRGDRRAGAMASPWSVLVAGGGSVLVAMAGTHELWRVEPASGSAGPVAGGRGEGLMDGPPADALLAQPAGLATDGRRVWWTDAESSAVRETSPAALGVGHEAGGDAVVRTLVGTGLFDFGLTDGEGDTARLQHPQGLAWVPGAGDDGAGRLLVADSYNDALRWLDPRTRRVETWRDGFAEPSGVAVAGVVAYVADTNAHRVAVVDLATGAVDPLAVVDARR